MSAFVSYANSYDRYVGEVGVAELSEQAQDELIRAIFDPDMDFRELVVQQRVLKSQAEGLWTIVVLLGMAQEAEARIRNFDSRTAEEIQLIISAISGTNLWLRLEEAYPPFNVLPKRTAYNWNELEPLQMEELASLAGEPLLEVKKELFKRLKSRPFVIKPNMDHRMPYHAFSPLYEQGKVILFVDRGLTAVAGSAGIVKSNAPAYMRSSMSALVATPIIWYLLGFLYAFPCAVLAVVLFRRSFSSLNSAVRSAALSDKEKYRWLLSRKVIWVQSK